MPEQQQLLCLRQQAMGHPSRDLDDRSRPLDQADQWSGASVFAGLARVAHWGWLIKRTEKKRVVEITRRMTHGLLAQAQYKSCCCFSHGGSSLSTGFYRALEWDLPGTVCELTRKSRHAARRLRALETGMHLIGCSYNFCFPHHELSKAKHKGFPRTPAMAAGLTDHIWSICELLSYRLAPAPWVPPKRPHRRSFEADGSIRPRLRLRKGVLCSTTR